MTLYEKIIAIYPELGMAKDANNRDIPNEAFINLTIILQNDSDGKGDYIAKWEHSTLPKPTQKELDAVK